MCNPVQVVLEKKISNCRNQLIVDFYIVAMKTTHTDTDTMGLCKWQYRGCTNNICRFCHNMNAEPFIGQTSTFVSSLEAVLSTPDFNSSGIHGLSYLFTDWNRKGNSIDVLLHKVINKVLQLKITIVKVFKYIWFSFAVFYFFMIHITTNLIAEVLPVYNFDQIQ